MTCITHAVFQPLPISLEKFLAHPATAAEVEQYLADNVSSTTLPMVKSGVPAPGSTEESVPPPENVPPATRYKAVEELLAAKRRAEAVSSDGKILFLVNNEGEGWAHVLDDVTTTPGCKALSWGSGKRMDEEAGLAKEKEGHTALPIKIDNDNAPFIIPMMEPKRASHCTA